MYGKKFKFSARQTYFMKSTNFKLIFVFIEYHFRRDLSERTQEALRI
jgi:hypothetical protein